MKRPGAPGSPLRGRYLVRNPLWNAWLHVHDFLLGVFVGRPPRAAWTQAEISTPRRILIAIGGHLGDAVIASTLVSRVAQAYPNAEIGLLSGSWSRQVLHSHARVRWTHVMDHWKLNRRGGSLFARWRICRKSAGRALAEIRTIGYDVAIDLAAYYPNSARLLWRAGIPVRVGYESGGGGPLYTHPVRWEPRDHVWQEHVELLARLTATNGDGVSATYELPPIPSTATRGAREKLVAAGFREDADKVKEGYVVVHMGAGHVRKEWPIENWRTVVRELVSSGFRVALTGAGAEERAVAQRVARSVAHCMDLTDQLDWNEFRAVIAGARAVLSVDTVAMHLAAAAGRPCVALMTGMDVPERWAALGKQVTILSERVRCSPCYRSQGCADMACIRGISPASAVSAAREYLAS